MSFHRKPVSKATSSNFKKTKPTEICQRAFHLYCTLHHALYFVDEVMPRFMEYLYQNCNVKTSKEYWGKLAKTGYEQELNKGGEKGKGSFGEHTIYSGAVIYHFI